MKNKLLIASAALLSVWTTGLLAASSRNYWYGGGRPDAWYSDQDWMGRLRNDTPLSQLSIPGTHDSGAYVAGGIFALTQSMSFLDQLIAGIRMWDLRLAGPSVGSCSPELTLYTYHGPFCQGTRFVDVIRAAVVFLYNHPTETVLIRVKREDISPLLDILTNEGFVNLLNDVLKGTVTVSGAPGPIRVADYLYKGSNSNPTLGELRKKILLFKDFSGDLNPELVYTRSWCDSASDSCPQPLAIQDKYDLRSNQDLAYKWRLVQRHLQDANATSTTDQSRLFVNFVSATALQNSGSGYPFFFASGKVSLQNGSPQLWTGFTTSNCPTFVCLPEFPTVRFANNLVFVYYEGINQLLARDLSVPRVRNRTGIVMMDFPGGGVIGDIIVFNNRHRVTQPPVARPDPTSDPGRWYNGPVYLTWNWESSTQLLNCPISAFVTQEGRNTTSSTCRDTSGLEGSSVVAINIDYVVPRGIVQLSRPVITGTSTGRPVVQTIAGSFEDILSGVDPITGRYLIEDSYGGTREGPVTLSTNAALSGLSNSTFFFQLSLDTRVIPNQPRTYRITIFALDRAGNPAQVSAEAVVR